MEIDKKKALWDMMNGVVSEESLALATQTKKVEQVAESKSPTSTVPKRHNNNYSNRSYDEDRYGQGEIDILAETKKRLERAKSMGNEEVYLNSNGPMNSQEHKIVPEDALKLLLEGRGKEAKEMLKQTAKPTQKTQTTDFDPLEIYSNKTIFLISKYEII